MLDIRNYIDHEKANAFRKAIVGIQNERVGVKSLQRHDSTYGVGGNTFRALRKLPERPSVVYRGWAESVFDRLATGEMHRSLRDQASFDQWHYKFAESLNSYWQQHQGQPLSVAHRYKFVDLYLKWVSELSLPNRADNEALISYGHCALDSQTLCALNSHLSGALPFKTIAMGDVHSETTYKFCQELCRTYCSIVGGTPLLFDYYVWKRGGSKSLE